MTLLLGCNGPKSVYPVPDKADIYNVIKAIVSQERVVSLFDSKGVLISRQPGKKDFITLKDFPLSVNLIKIRVDTSANTAFRSVLYQELIASKYFTKKDSAYLFFQNDTLSHFDLDTTTLHGMKFTSDFKLKNQWSKGHRNLHFYRISIPLFSADRNTVRVYIYAISAFEMGGDYVFYLQKKNSEWKIIKQEQVGVY